MAKAYADRGLSYAQIAEKMSCSVSGVYYALNPRRRGQVKRVAPAGPQRTVYLPDWIWDGVVEVALHERVSYSAVVARMLTSGERVEVEPVIGSLEVGGGSGRAVGGSL